MLWTEFHRLYLYVKSPTICWYLGMEICGTLGGLVFWKKHLRSYSLSFLTMWSHSKNVAVDRMFTEQRLYISTEISNLPPPELCEINLCCLRHPIYVFVLFWFLFVLEQPYLTKILLIMCESKNEKIILHIEANTNLCSMFPFIGSSRKWASLNDKREKRQQEIED